jgi:hypothetical protein
MKKNIGKVFNMKLRKPSEINWDTKGILNEDKLFNPDDLEKGLKLIENKFKKLWGMTIYEIKKNFRKGNKIKRSLKRSK